MTTRIFLLSIIAMILFGSCTTQKEANVSYSSEALSAKETPKLNVFSPRNTNSPKDVLVFVHGGDWNSGNKGIYNFFGRHFASKDVVTVIPGYTLSPNANYDMMTRQIAEAIQWTFKNIADYGGNPNRIFVTGHSAGGHLVGLATMNPKYLGNDNPVKGIIFNDAAALDMHNYLQKNPPKSSNNYVTTWTTNPEEWENASPINFIDAETPPIKIYLGTKTYPSILEGNRRFIDALKEFQPNVSVTRLDKKHVAMMSQYFWNSSDRYDEIVKFMRSVD